MEEVVKVYVIKDGSTLREGIYLTRKIAESYARANEEVYEEAVIESPNDLADVPWLIEDEKGEALLASTTGERWVVPFSAERFPRRVYRLHASAVKFCQHQLHTLRVVVNAVRYVDGQEDPLPRDTRIIPAQ